MASTNFYCTSILTFSISVNSVNVKLDLEKLIVIYIDDSVFTIMAAGNIVIRAVINILFIIAYG